MADKWQYGTLTADAQGGGSIQWIGPDDEDDRWEFDAKDAAAPSRGLVDVLNERGAQGWKIVDVDRSELIRIYVMSRPKP